MRELPVAPGDRFPLLATAVVGALVLVVLAVGAVAMAAEFLNTWEHYFLMEQAIAAATPVVAALAVAAVLVGVGAVARS